MNIENLKLVRNHLMDTVLKEYPDRFDMGSFSESASYEFWNKSVASYVEQDFCGTAACVVGHATTVIPMLPQDAASGLGNSFSLYSYRVFNLSYRDDAVLWNFLFSSRWGDLVSSHTQIKQAAARIDYVIENGTYDHNFSDGSRNPDFQDYTLTYEPKQEAQNMKKKTPLQEKFPDCKEFVVINDSHYEFNLGDIITLKEDDKTYIPAFWSEGRKSWCYVNLQKIKPHTPAIKQFDMVQVSDKADFSDRKPIICRFLADVSDQDYWSMSKYPIKACSVTGDIFYSYKYMRPAPIDTTITFADGATLELSKTEYDKLKPKAKL